MVRQNCKSVLETYSAICYAIVRGKWPEWLKKPTQNFGEEKRLQERPQYWAWISVTTERLPTLLSVKTSALHPNRIIPYTKQTGLFSWQTLTAYRYWWYWNCELCLNLAEATRPKTTGNCTMSGFTIRAVAEVLLKMSFLGRYAVSIAGR